MNTYMRMALFPVMVILVCAVIMAADIYVPQVEGDWWQIAGNPDLGDYTSPDQQPVDFGVWQAADGTWQLWSCIRHTKCGGHTRLFHRWQGTSPTEKDWEPMGVAMLSEERYGEPLGGLQAPHVVRWNGLYWLAYGDWERICLAVGRDGKTFDRVIRGGSAALFTQGSERNTRDAMLLFTKGMWHCYYTAAASGHGYVYCRTSENMFEWSDGYVVSYGGRSGTYFASAECPHVVELSPGSYYLFRTQVYGPGSKSMVYHGTSPYDFGIDDDSHFVTELPIAAPEIILHEGRYYIAALNLDLDGIRMARLAWRKLARAFFDFDNAAQRSGWKRIEGDIDPIFTTSKRSNFYPKSEYFIGTAEIDLWHYDDGRTGIIESPVFTVTDSDYIFLVSGGSDTDKTYVALLDAETKEIVRKISGHDNNQFEQVHVDLSGHHGREMLIRVVDRARGPWGHINFGGVYTLE